MHDILQVYCKDSTVILEVDPDDTDVMIMTCVIDDVVAWRKFHRVTLPNKPNRKISAPF